MNIFQKNKNNVFLQASRIAVVVFAVAFLVFGISRGEVQTVLQKAIMICMECIGID